VVAVLIITDVRLYREGLTRLLAAASDLRVLGCYSPAESVPPFDEGMRNCVLLSDSATVRRCDVAARLRLSVPEIKVVVFGVSEEDEEEIIACAEIGVAGFVARDASAEELVTVIRSAACGDVRCSPRVTAVVLRRVAQYAPPRSERPAEARLTRRETQVLALIDAGHSNKKIALSLGLETATVKNHVHNILEKLQVERRGEAAAFVRAQRRLPGARPAGALPT